MNENVALKACPFCGGKALIVTRDVEPQGDPYYGKRMETFPQCQECSASAFNDYFHEGFYHREEAIAAWNRRTLDEPKGVSDEMVEAALSAPVRHANGPTVSDFLGNAYPEAKRDILRAALQAALDCAGKTEAPISQAAGESPAPSLFAQPAKGHLKWELSEEARHDIEIIEGRRKPAEGHLQEAGAEETAKLAALCAMEGQRGPRGEDAPPGWLGPVEANRLQEKIRELRRENASLRAGEMSVAEAADYARALGYNEKEIPLVVPSMGEVSDAEVEAALDAQSPESGATLEMLLNEMLLGGNARKMVRAALLAAWNARSET